MTGRMSGSTRIISWNLLHSIGAEVEHVHALIETHAPDLLLMQEAGAKIDALPKIAGGFYARVALPGRHHGLAAWSRQAFFVPAESIPLQRGLVVRRVCQIIAMEGFSVANVHLSHGQVLNRRQLRRIAAVLPARAAILGDCNMLGSPFLPGFQDAGLREPTHKMSGLIPLRLDRCFIRDLRCEKAEILENGASDHKPLMVELGF